MCRSARDHSPEFYFLIPETTPPRREPIVPSLFGIQAKRGRKGSRAVADEPLSSQGGYSGSQLACEENKWVEIVERTIQRSGLSSPHCLARRRKLLAIR